MSRSDGPVVVAGADGRDESPIDAVRHCFGVHIIAAEAFECSPLRAIDPQRLTVHVVGRNGIPRLRILLAVVRTEDFVTNQVQARMLGPQGGQRLLSTIAEIDARQIQEDDRLAVDVKVIWVS